MKTKLLALALLAGGSVFAQTRSPFGATAEGNSRGYSSQAHAYATPAPLFGHAGDAGRYDYSRDQSYAPQPVTRGYDENQYRASSRRGDRDDQRFDSRGRAFDRDEDRDDRDHGSGNRQDFRQNEWSTRSRNR